MRETRKLGRRVKRESYVPGAVGMGSRGGSQEAAKPVSS